jgi:hypothetical protein
MAKEKRRALTRCIIRGMIPTFSGAIVSEAALPMVKLEGGGEGGSSERDFEREEVERRERREGETRIQTAVTQ